MDVNHPIVCHVRGHVVKPGYGTETLFNSSIDSRVFNLIVERSPYEMCNDLTPTIPGGVIFGYLCSFFSLRCDLDHYCSYSAYNAPFEGRWTASCFGVSLSLF